MLKKCVHIHVSQYLSIHFMNSTHKTVYNYYNTILLCIIKLDYTAYSIYYVFRVYFKFYQLDKTGMSENCIFLNSFSTMNIIELL